jgi:hypothetical protein
MGRTFVLMFLVGLCWPVMAAAQPSGRVPEPGPQGPYYNEPPAPPPGQGQRASPPPGVYEPPPPGYYYGPVYEPPPPPKPKHRAPKTAFWLGGRLGYFVPFGNLLLEYNAATKDWDQAKWSHYASSGMMFEGDIGARFSRRYNVFLLWEHASLDGGSAKPDPIAGSTVTSGPNQAGTDYHAIGLRFSSDADRVGFLTEIDLGFRRFHATWEDGTKLEMSEAPLEFRIGLGADIRVAPMFSLSPMITLGAGAFGAADWVRKDGSRVDGFGPNDETAGHGWITLQLGGHFDIPGGDGD